MMNEFDINYKNHSFVFTPYYKNSRHFTCNKCNSIAILGSDNRYYMWQFGEYINENHLTCEEVIIKSIIE